VSSPRPRTVAELRALYLQSHSSAKVEAAERLAFLHCARAVHAAAVGEMVRLERELQAAVTRAAEWGALSEGLAAATAEALAAAAPGRLSGVVVHRNDGTELRLFGEGPEPLF
jgi:hypothetical protein